MPNRIDSIHPPTRTAVILAAGLGRRLGERGKYRPKGFLRLGAHSIVEESLGRLIAAGVERVVIVTGHRAEFYHRLRDRYPNLIETVHNPEFATSGSMYSLYCARHRIDSGFLLLESDLVYGHRALDWCLRFPFEDLVLLSNVSGSEGEIYVEVASGRLCRMSRRRDDLAREPAGELVGISKISYPLYRVMLNQAETMFSDTLDIDYEIHGLVAAAEKHSIYCFLGCNLIWSDIDTEAQLRWVSQNVYHLIS